METKSYNIAGFPFMVDMVQVLLQYIDIEVWDVLEFLQQLQAFVIHLI